jgi:SpoVK/Ycf46/Vps4 family AAA+-type ATPase
MTIRLDGLFSRFLGATAAHLKSIFQEMEKRTAVYLFDEFDAIGKTRGDANEVGEIWRVVTSFLQLLDSDDSNSLVIAATNFDRIIDRAAIRRFDAVIHFELPTFDQIIELISLRLGSFNLADSIIRKAAELSKGLSFADIARACEFAVKSMALDRRRHLSPDDVFNAFEEANSRAKLLA